MRWLAILVLALAAPSAGSRIATAAETTSATFAVSWAGLDVGLVKLELVADAAAYRLSWQGRTTGWFATLFPFESDGSAAGQVQGASFRPESYDGRSAWRDGDARWRVAFAPDGRVARLEVPPEDLTTREPVPETLRVGPDPASLALSAVRQAEPGLRVAARSFDGRRAFAYELACAEQVDLASGAELACSVFARLLAGASRRWGSGSGAAEREPALIWLRRAGDGRFWPVRLEVSSRFGAVTARLLAWESPPAPG